MFWFAQIYKTWIFYAVGFVAMGIGLEFLQGTLGYRQADVLDMVANTLGIAAGWGAARILPRLLPTA